MSKQIDMFKRGYESYTGKDDFNVSEFIKLDRALQMRYHQGFFSAIIKAGHDNSPEFQLYWKVNIEGDDYMEANMHKMFDQLCEFS